MKHLFRNRAIRLPILLVLVVFAFSVSPTIAWANRDVSNGGNCLDGDPGDGLGYTGGGGGGFLPPTGENTSSYSEKSTRIFIIWVTGNAYYIPVIGDFHTEKYLFSPLPGKIESPKGEDS